MATTPSLTCLNCYNSAADCSISLKFGAEFGHVTADTRQTFKVKRSEVKITAWRKVSAVKIVISQELIGWLSSNSKIMSVWSAFFTNVQGHKIKQTGNINLTDNHSVQW